jgi:acetolactate synthase-1/2/3 large subunit
LAIPQVGYDISELAREAKIAVVDIDPEELKKYPTRFNFPVCADAGDFIREMLIQLEEPVSPKNEWIAECNDFKTRYPWVTNTDHPDEGGFINSYPFLEKLNQHFKPDQIVVTDMGTALLSGHQVLKLKKGQRLLTSTGLGEMGYGLPAALGASFGTNRGEVICLNCDGGIMMNLQELQTMVHHKLPIKIFIFNNDGYLMIKHTQKSLFKGHYAGTDKISGVSCPDFSKIAKAFDLPSHQIRTWEDFDQQIPAIMAHSGPLICEVFMHPEQFFFPKLSLAVQPDGSLVSPPLEDLSPLLPRAEMEKNMLLGMHPKSKMIADS